VGEHAQLGGLRQRRACTQSASHVVSNVVNAAVSEVVSDAVSAPRAAVRIRLKVEKKPCCMVSVSVDQKTQRDS